MQTISPVSVIPTTKKAPLPAIICVAALVALVVVTQKKKENI
jgi:hypothetical protein